jgi:hypothetical protein
MSADHGGALPAGGAPSLCERRVRHMLLWYPPSWRARYGEEFAELLLADLADRPRSWRRAADLAATGMRARLATVGLAAHPINRAVAARASLATAACSAAAFGVFGGALWAQLAIGVQWDVPPQQGISQALGLMTAALALFALLAVIAGAGVLGAAARMCRSGRGRQLAGPATLVAVGALVLILGGRYFANDWPGTGGHLLVHQGLVPGGVAAFGWATTMWVSSYWLHPAALAAFGTAEIAWMVASPAATAVLVTGAARLLRRIELSPAGLRYELWLGRIAAVSMLALLAGALRWITLPALGDQMFHAGLIDVAGLVAVAVAAAAGGQAVRRATAVARVGGSAR